MLNSCDTKLIDLILRARERGSKKGLEKIDPSMVLSEAGEYLGGAIPSEIPDGEAVSIPELTQEILTCVKTALSKSNSGTVDLEGFFIALCECGDISDMEFSSVGIKNRKELLDRLLRDKGEKEALEELYRPSDSIIGSNGRDLTALANSGSLKRPAKREEECLQVINVLSRMEKSNPILIGDAGTGKTAIAEGVAHMVASIDSGKLHGARVIDLPASVFLDSYRKGDGEEFVRRLVKEIIQDEEDGQPTILFVDEIHLLMENTAIIDLLKPCLAREGFRMMGATTFTEYRRYIEKNEAFSRRFSPVHVREFSPDVAVEVVVESCPRLESHHRLTISQEAIEAAVHLSHRYIPHRRLPDKAFDVLDMACVAASCSGVVEASHVKEAVAKVSNLPLSAINNDFLQSCSGLKRKLSRRVKGQKLALDRVSSLLNRSAVGLKDNQSRPLGSFLFVGTTGTGKTELAKGLAEAFFGSEGRMIRLDMSEYSEQSSISRLIGSSPGYVGSEKGGVLTEAIRKNPFTMILVDELEKADPSVIRLFLQILDEGRLSDASGESFDFRNSLLIFTTNAMAHDHRPSIGFIPEKERSREEQSSFIEGLNALFSREMLGRFDEIVRFEDLGEDTLFRLFASKLIEKRKTLRETHGIGVDVKKDALKALSKMAYGKPAGGREVNRLLQSKIYDPLADLIVKGFRGKVIVSTDGNGGVTISA